MLLSVIHTAGHRIGVMTAIAKEAEEEEEEEMGEIMGVTEVMDPEVVVVEEVVMMETARTGLKWL